MLQFQTLILVRTYVRTVGWCKTWTLDSGLDSWTGLWTEIWTGFWTDTQFNDDHFQHSVALNGLGYALATAYPVCSKTRLLFMPFMLL